jgi:S-(hydroxymethyl)glutathione dehydrogenase/alcohol dehydrogenase
MKAAVLSAAGAPLAIEEVPTPRPQADEVLVKVAACGVCHTDLHVMKGEVKLPVPCVLGHEISGHVESAGAGVANVRPGDAVVASFIMPCGRCPFCARGRDDLCETFFAMNRLKGALYDGTSRLRRADGSALAMYSMGGLAEFAVVPATDVFPAPAGLPLVESCILGCAIMTAYGCRVRTDMPEILAHAGRGRIDVAAPITRRYPLDQADAAYQALARGEILGRAIVTM